MRQTNEAGPSPASHGRLGPAQDAEPTPTKPLMPADFTPAVEPHAVGSGFGENVSTPMLPPPLYNVVLIVLDRGWPRLGWIAFSVTLAIAFPSSTTAPVAEYVSYWRTVYAPEDHFTIEIP